MRAYPVQEASSVLGDVICPFWQVFFFFFLGPGIARFLAVSPLIGRHGAGVGGGGGAFFST